MTTRRTFLIGSVSAAAVALSACGESAPKAPTATGSPEPQAVLDEERLEAALARIDTALAAADEARDAQALAGYVSGPAARLRAAEYYVATGTGDDSAVHTFTLTNHLLAVVGRTLDFPRSAVVITEPEAEGKAPFMHVLSQEGAREEFQLWGWVALFGKSSIPKTPAIAVGAEQITGDSQGLVSTPQQVLDAYIDALNNPEGDNGQAFADDLLRQHVQGFRDTNFDEQGTITVTSTAGSDGIRGLRTSEGGALVMAPITIEMVYQKTVAGATLNVGEPHATLLDGGSEIIGTVTVTYEATIALSIPSASEGGQPVALGMEKALAGVERDDSAAPAE